ncbi:autophagy-related protein 13-like [Centruroides vittatus]|uniref:autophagy-related protein 13-like n=1 Tax=Centruroides vittatus TaxID=120091 RepID=UPI00350F1FB7
MTSKLSSDDHKRLERFTKSLVLKTVQVIVQSRLGEKVKTHSNRHSSATDWFNLAIPDEMDVQIETKKALAGQIPNLEDSTCVEISLTTVDGDTLVLETWHLGMNEQNDPVVKILPTVYNRIGLMLKSLIAVSRVTPAYRLSCRQGHDTYVICYKVYMGNPQYNLLGDGYEECLVGQVATPVGTLTLSVAYRTNLTITPQRSEKVCPFLVKSDYFERDASPKFQCHRCCSDPSAYSSNFMNKITRDGNLSHTGCSVPNGNQTCPQSFDRKDVKMERNENNKDARFKREKCFGLTESKVGAFVPSNRRPDPSPLPDLLLPDTPFLNLVQNDSDNNPISDGPVDGKKERTSEDVVDRNANMETANRNAINSNNVTRKKYGNFVDLNSNPQDCNYRKSSGSENSPYDFVMVELKPSFADWSGNGDLGAFFRECQSAPPLTSFESQPSLEEQVVEIKNQLAVFETSMKDFDDFVDTLCRTESRKNSD